MLRRAFTNPMPTFRLATPMRSMSMFCMQCEQTNDGSGCTTVGVCGKTAETAALQDLLVHSMKGLGVQMETAKGMGVALPADANLNSLALNSLFSTLTNVNFSENRIGDYVADVEAAKAKLAAAGAGEAPAAFAAPTGSVAEMEARGREVGVLARGDPTSTVVCLGELLMYGVKGLSAYAAHALALGKTDPKVSEFVYEALAYVSKPTGEQTAEELLALCLRAGEMNLIATGLLNDAHVSTFGAPAPTRVRMGGIKGKAIVISGHDLGDLAALLDLVDKSNARRPAEDHIRVYTHGEMLPAHGYPAFNTRPALAGNYGSAWQNQKFEFSKLDAPILMTSNCLVEPTEAYRHRIFSTNAVGFDGVPHLPNKDFQAVVDKALECEGFTEDEPEIYSTTGFGLDAVLGAAGAIVEGVQAGHIKNFFLIGGCDGSESERSYYKKLAKAIKEDKEGGGVILTLGCAKYRFNKLFDGETVPGTGLPRMIDMGQCNDSYAAVQTVVALSQALDTPVNDLPVHMALSWFEQKAVAVLLSLLHLGIKGIHIGPKLPAFVNKDVLDILVSEYGLTPIGEARADLDKFKA